MTATSTRRLVGVLAAVTLPLALGLAPVQPSRSPLAGAPASAAAAVAPAAAPVTVTGLKTNGRTNPLGISARRLSFGWYGESTARGVVQRAYQVRVATSVSGLTSAVTWDTGKTLSAEQTGVAYQGQALASQTRYYWQVRTWDGQDVASEWSAAAWFETGLLTSADWGKAEWIGGTAPPGVDLWTDYTTEVVFDIDEGGFGLVVRNSYLWRVTLDGGTPLLLTYQRFNGGWALFGRVDLSSYLTAAELRGPSHTLSVSAIGRSLTTKIDNRQVDSRTVGQLTDYVTSGLVALRSETGDDVSIESVKVVATTGQGLMSTDFSGNNSFDGGDWGPGHLDLDGQVEAQYVVPAADAAPLLRTTFSTQPGKTITRARVYATARGLYQMRLNGERVGDQHLAPGWTDYRHRFQHQTYDVTGQVRAGDNAWGAELGKGWYAGRVGPKAPPGYGADIALLARLRVDYSDGSSQWVDTRGPEWRSSVGPHTTDDLIDGESYDHRMAQVGWDTVDFDDIMWRHTQGLGVDRSMVVPQPDEPVRTTEMLPATVVTSGSSGATYDLGQNIAGSVRVVLQGEPGTTVTIKYAEALDTNGLATKTLRGAKATDTYTFDSDRPRVYEPAFTIHGFRYLRIYGTTPPAKEQVTGLVWGSDLTRTGDLNTSSPLLNQIYDNIAWGVRDNFVSIPTDTPSRDERLGWTGDVNVIAPTASYLSDTRAFLTKWMDDLRDDQQPNGNFPSVAPQPPKIAVPDSAGWSDAGIAVPHAVWESTGDTSIVREFYPSMRRFIDYVVASAGSDLIERNRGDFGDWLNLGDKTSPGVVGTAYLYQDLSMMAEMAAAIGQTQDAQAYTSLASQVRDAFNQKFVKADGTVSDTSFYDPITQGGYAMALGMGLIKPEQKEQVGGKLAVLVDTNGNRLTTGLLATQWLLPALSESGYADFAWKLMVRDTFPSWGYEVRMGATTLWERWNSITPEGRLYDDSMNSLNHYYAGAVGEWMHRSIAAIAPAAAGYRKIRVAPLAGYEGVDEASGSLDSTYGPIRTHWTTTGDDMTLDVDVPVGTTAEVVLPRDQLDRVREGGRLLSAADGVTSYQLRDGSITAVVGSGSYRFTYSAGHARLGRLALDADDIRRGLTDGSGMASAERAAVDRQLVDVSADLSAAVDAEASGGAVAAPLQAAMRHLRDLRLWLQSSAVSGASLQSLDARLTSLDVAMSTVLGEETGLRVDLGGGSGGPGETAQGSFSLRNSAPGPATVTGWVQVADWAPVRVGPVSVPAGGLRGVPLSVRVPGDAARGRYDVEASLNVVSGAATYDLTALRREGFEVQPRLQIGVVTASPQGPEPVERTILYVPVTNEGTAPVTLRADVSGLPTGWRAGPSSSATVAAGQTQTLAMTVLVSHDLLFGGGQPVTGVVSVSTGGVEAARRNFAFPFDLTVPPAGAIDSVDWGDPASEQAHGLQAYQASGTDVLAGLTRRYANISTPGSWFSAELKVPPGKPFVLRTREVFAGNEKRSYEIVVDNWLVETVTSTRTQTAPGSKVYDVLVDNPHLLQGWTGDGKVRVMFRFPGDSPGDPSIADTWVLPAEDRMAPTAWIDLDGGAAGIAPWYRSAPRALLSAVDNRMPVASLQVKDPTSSTPGTWQTYSAPVTVTGDGTHLLYGRAVDGAGNTSSERSVQLRVDGTGPTTTMVVDSSSSQPRLVFNASDPVSGVREKVYRIDGGPWLVIGSTFPVLTTSGAHVVEYYSTDNAGNYEPVRRSTVTVG